MTCAYATWDGAYVLGALTPAERERYERHLSGCPACADSVGSLAGLPGLLSRIDEYSVSAPPEAAPDTLLPRLVREVRRERRGRARVATGLAAAVVVTAVAGVAALGALPGADTPDAAPPVSASPTGAAPPGAGSPDAGARAMEPVDGAPVAGWLTLETVPWGTRLTLLCTYAPAPGRYGDGGPVGYAMVVSTRDGGEQQVATWNAVPGHAMQLAAATAAGRADITSVEVRTAAGRPVLRLPG